jgi:hypothetical protein
MKGRLIAALVVALALVAPAAAQAPGDFVAGSARDVTGATQDHVAVAAHSGPLGEDPRGQIVLRTANPQTGEVQTYHADVSTGCVLVAGNTAVVVGTLPEEDQFDVPPPAPQPFHITSLGVVIQQGTEQGRASDLAQPIFLRAQSAAGVCAGTLTLQLIEPLVGNFVIEDAPPA